ncbi:MAG: class I SAM-dependent methyltransferase [Acidimicrobiales bacterium]
MDEGLRAVARDAIGFMPEAEGLALYEAARRACAARPGDPLLEVGTYCGKSAVYLGAAALDAGTAAVPSGGASGGGSATATGAGAGTRAGRRTVLFTVDHHRGSEENQPGWEHHDPRMVDPATGRIDTLPFFRTTMAAAGLEETVVAIVGPSLTVAGHWAARLALLFIDGGHGAEPAHADYQAWTPHVAPGGLLAIHDVFPDPSQGGRPPFEIYRRALDSRAFVELDDAGEGSLRVLERHR